MQPSFAKKLEIQAQKTDISAQKIDDPYFKTFDMVIAIFQMDNKAERFQYFEEIFILADISISVTLCMPFLILSNVEINFAS